MSILLRGGTRRDGHPADLRIRDDGSIADIGPTLDPTASDSEVIDLGGGGILPGLHDHHVHLLATAAEADSTGCGPPTVTSARALRATLEAAAGRPGGDWIRGVGYHESVAGSLDRVALERLAPPTRPVRIQHRSGALWMLNGAALERLRLGHPGGPAHPGVERSPDGLPTGRVWRADAWLRSLPGWSTGAPPDLVALGHRMAGLGLTGVTDATPAVDPDAIRWLATLPQRVTLLGVDPQDLPDDAALSAGPRKLVLADHDLPTLPELTKEIAHLRGPGRRPIAVHAVSRVSLILLLTALATEDAVPGDRIEHAAVVPDSCLALMAGMGLAVVTQPSFLSRRGEDYRRDVDPEDLPVLYRHAGLLAAGIGVGLSSDAPYGDLNPWRSIAAAQRRETRPGHRLAPEEAVPAEVALDGFLTAPHAPAGPPRVLATGHPADLCILTRPVADVLADRDEDPVALTVIGGRICYRA